MEATEKVAVIGAGAAGLAVARQLALEGFEPVIFEAESRLGGTWVYTEDLESDPLGRDPDRYRVSPECMARRLAAGGRDAVVGILYEPEDADDGVMLS